MVRQDDVKALEAITALIRELNQVEGSTSGKMWEAKQEALAAALMASCGIAHVFRPDTPPSTTTLPEPLQTEQIVKRGDENPYESFLARVPELTPNQADSLIAQQPTGAWARRLPELPGAEI